MDTVVVVEHDFQEERRCCWLVRHDAVLVVVAAAEPTGIAAVVAARPYWQHFVPYCHRLVVVGAPPCWLLRPSCSAAAAL